MHVPIFLRGFSLPFQKAPGWNHYIGLAADADVWHDGAYDH